LLSGKVVFDAHHHDIHDDQGAPHGQN
jgi:UV DNA damage repair endonuclease